MLEDLITTAMNQATSQALSEMQSKMKALTGGINIPGLF
jgi:DNA-binding protein YbaB